MNTKNAQSEDAALLQYAQNRVNPYEKSQGLQDLRQRILNRMGLDYSYDSSSEVRAFGEKVRFNPISPGETPDYQGLQSQIQTEIAAKYGSITPSIQLSNLQIPGISKNPALAVGSSPVANNSQNQDSNASSNFNVNFDGFLNKIEKFTKAPVINITNQFQQADAETMQVARKNEQQVRKELKDVFILASHS